jgi:hypothetical protein
VRWRDFAFGAGAIGDRLSRPDAACWALDLRDPRGPCPAGSQMDAEISPHSEMVYWDFAARGDRRIGDRSGRCVRRRIAPASSEGCDRDREMPGAAPFVGEQES